MTPYENRNVPAFQLAVQGLPARLQFRIVLQLLRLVSYSSGLLAQPAVLSVAALRSEGSGFVYIASFLFAGVPAKTCVQAPRR